ncbi:hypothetical protein A9Q92_01780 [Methylophaga sp. 42_8_T64]|nr:hypothetical protein A9Q92_01780 [Methylophaga sp. 42_8_T64]
MTKNIELWDDEANHHIWGVLTDDNKVELTVNDKVKINGELQGNKFDLGQKNNSIWGFLNGDKIELWDDHLHHMSGELT